MLVFALLGYFARGMFAVGWAFGGMILVLFGSQALAAGTLSVLMKRMERRLTEGMSRAPASSS
jgi:hypothetical protein